MNRRVLAWIGLLALGALFAAGVVRLLELRFRAGDVYPPYSTFRADPRGAKAFHDALAEVPGLAVSRRLHTPAFGAPAAEGTLFYLGLSPSAFAWADEEEIRGWAGFAAQGGRLVLVLDGAVPPPKPHVETEKEKKEKEKAKGQDGEKPARPIRTLAMQWQIELKALDLPDDGKGLRANRDAAAPDALPPELPWHGRVALAPAPESPWRVLYRAGDAPVGVERNFGLGTIVVLADGLLVQNEALARRPEPGLLAWLAGAARRVEFDETCHGVVENPGIASLGRRYRLGGLAAGLACLFALFVWRNGVGFLPARPAPAAPEEAAGRDATAGLANLLGRRLGLGGVLEACLDQWEKAFRRTPGAAARLAAARAYLAQPPAARPGPVEAYRALRALLAPRR